MKKYVFMPFLLVLFAGCQAVDQFSPDQVMENAIASEKEDVPYYGEMTMKIEDADGAFEMDVEEWRKGDTSLEKVTSDGETMITLKEGNTVLMYDEAENVLYETEFDDMNEVNLSSKERVEKLLELTEDTHTLEKKEDETIAGREAIHLVAEKKPDKKSLFGTQEIWVDKENWLVLKTTDHSADSQSVMEYTKLTLDPDLSDDVFELDIPDDVTVESFGEDFSEEEITLEEAVEKLARPFLYVQEAGDISLEEITYFDTEGDEQLYQSVDMTYNKEGLPYIELSIVANDDPEASMEDDDEEESFSEPIDIRQQTGSYFDLDEMKVISWEEDDLEYSMWFINPNMTLAQMKTIIEAMEEIATEK